MSDLKAARENLKISQSTIAKSLNIELRTYQYIESQLHEPRVSTALKICSILDLNPYEIEWGKKRQQKSS